MIRAVIFDYFGVISSDGYWQLVKEDKNMHGSFGELSSAVNSGRIAWHDFLAEVASRTGRNLEEIDRLYKTERLDPDLIAFIDSLHARYKTGLLTNAHHEFLEPLIHAAGLSHTFDNVTISSRIGAVKPQPAMYHAALHALQIEPEEAVFIDDLARNVDGAIAVGMRGIVYEDLPRLKIAFAHMGIAGRVDDSEREG